MKSSIESYKEGAHDGIPIMLGYFGVSFSFGILGTTGGLAWWQTTLISLTNLTSAGQFAGLNIMLASGTYFEMIIAQFIINLRYALMSISLSQKVDSSFKGIFRMLLGFGMTDEIFGVASNHKGEVRRSYFFGLMTTPMLGWTIGTLCGAVLGAILPSMVVDALGIALYGMFIAIVVPEMKRDKKVIVPVLIAVALSCTIKYVPALKSISVGFSVIICAVAASVIGAIFFPVSDEEEGGETP